MKIAGQHRSSCCSEMASNVSRHTCYNAVSICVYLRLSHLLVVAFEWRRLVAAARLSFIGTVIFATVIRLRLIEWMAAGNFPLLFFHLIGGGSVSSIR